MSEEVEKIPSETMSQSHKASCTSIGRRSLLKKLALSSGVVTAASLLPGTWIKPVVGLGVLPAHAQMSQGEPGPGKILSCDYDVGRTTLYPVCTITPPTAGVSMTLTILIGGVPSVVLQATTDASGKASLTIDATTLGWNGIDTLVLEWSFTYLSDGEDTCSSTVELQLPQPE